MYTHVLYASTLLPQTQILKKLIYIYTPIKEKKSDIKNLEINFILFIKLIYLPENLTKYQNVFRSVSIVAN